MHRCAMPGRLFLTTPLDAIAQHFGATPTVPPSPPRFNVAPGQDVFVCTAAREIVTMRWGMIPVGRVNARGRPVMETIINARSETVFQKSAYEGTSRAIVPADGWYEWTGRARHKTAWRIAPKGGGLLAFAAICDVWAGPGGTSVHQVATVTCPPSPDVIKIHDRMGVLLDPEHVETWLADDEAAAATLMRPYPKGRLVVREAKGVDWTAP